jgi:hypothetical protein
MVVVNAVFRRDTADQIHFVFVNHNTILFAHDQIRFLTVTVKGTKIFLNCYCFLTKYDILTSQYSAICWRVLGRNSVSGILEAGKR